MKEQRSKQFVKGFISTEMTIIFMATSYRKTVQGLEAVIPIGGGRGPHHFRHNFETLLCARGVTP